MNMNWATFFTVGIVILLVYLVGTYTSVLVVHLNAQKNHPILPDNSTNSNGTVIIIIPKNNTEIPIPFPKFSV